MLVFFAARTGMLDQILELSLYKIRHLTEDVTKCMGLAGGPIYAVLRITYTEY